jgi:2-polyprenyl-3-methyl-5-hydroxy-6-metoxy-1,4-benzoquinol methylase
VGAGNSRLSEEMFEEGYTHITNVDISNVCIKAMKDKYKEKP